MAFTILPDYTAKADAEDIRVLLKGGTVAIFQILEYDVKQEIASYLDARYNLANVFIDVVQYDNTLANVSGDKVYDATGGKYYICIADAPVATPITDTNFFRLTQAADMLTPIVGPFIPGADLRIPIIKRIAVNLILHERYKAINPRMVPDFIKEQREESISWLTKVANPKHNINASFLPLNDYGNPQKSNNISWGSSRKVITNKY